MSIQMKSPLKISKDLSLTADSVTSTFVIYGGKGMGKTHFIAVLCEELFNSSLRFSLLDPLGVSWGLQSSSTGKGPGIDVLILGGIHGDIPIDPSSGAVVADFVVDEPISVVIDISRDASGRMWEIEDAIRFTGDYCRRLYQRQGEKRVPLMQIFDEAAFFVPQIIEANAKGLARCAASIKRLVAWGRNVGVGVTLIAQRSADMNKSVSELADAMFAFRTVGPKTIAAIDEWLSNHHIKTQRNEILEKIRALPIGSAMMVSPGWLKSEMIVSVRSRTTFDSSATPKPGASIKQPKKISQINIEKYVKRMQDVVDRAVADDPARLKKMLAETQAQLKKMAVSNQPKALPVKMLDTARLKQATVKLNELKALMKQSRNDFTSALARLEKMDAASAILAEVIAMSAKPKSQTTPFPEVLVMPPRGYFAPKDIARADLVRAPEGQKASKTITRMIEGQEEFKKLPKCEARILRVLQGCGPCTKAQIAIRAIYNVTGGGFNNALGALRRLELINGNGDMIELTENGRQVASSFTTVMPMLAVYIREAWYAKLPKAEREILRTLCDAANGASLSKEDVAAHTGYEVSGGGFNNAIGALRRMELISGRNDLQASRFLFDDVALEDF